MADHCPHPNPLQGANYPNANEEQPVKFSFIIQIPSPDLDTQGREQIKATLALRDIEALKDYGYLVPREIIDFFHNMHYGYKAHRCEIIVGSNQYKMYVQPQPESNG